MTPIRLHDTRSGELRELVPRADGRLGIHACAAGNCAEADPLRDELRARDWEARDRPGGPELIRIEQ